MATLYEPGHRNGHGDGSGGEPGGERGHRSGGEPGPGSGRRAGAERGPRRGTERETGRERGQRPEQGAGRESEQETGRGPGRDTERGPGDGGGTGRPVKSPTDMPARSLKGVLRRTLAEFKADDLTDRAAALTYYGVLAIFPALLALVSILGLLGSSAIHPLIDNLGSLAPGSVRNLLKSALQQVQGNQGAASIGLIVGILVALWSASGYVAAFMRAANAVYDIGEGRPAWKTLPVRMGVTVAVVVLLALTAIGVVVTGPLAGRVGGLLGLGGTALTVWNIAKWPVMLLLVSMIFALLYWAAPNVRRRFRWVTPGGLLAVVIWLVASALFALYVASFSSYDKTYGSFAAPIVALVWLWISNIALLLGLEFNSELERGRAIEGGHPPAREPYAEPRDTRKL